MNENEQSYVIIGAAIEVHKELGGPGMLEDVYEEALCYELELRGMTVERQARFRVIYKGKELKKQLVIDLIVNGIVLVEVKAVEQCHEVHESQLLTYSPPDQSQARPRHQLRPSLCQTRNPSRRPPTRTR